MSITTIPLMKNKKWLRTEYVAQWMKKVVIKSFQLFISVMELQLVFVSQLQKNLSGFWRQKEIVIDISVQKVNES